MARKALSNGQSEPRSAACETQPATDLMRALVAVELAAAEWAPPREASVTIPSRGHLGAHWNDVSAGLRDRYRARCRGALLEAIEVAEAAATAARHEVASSGLRKLRRLLELVIHPSGLDAPGLRGDFDTALDVLVQARRQLLEGDNESTRGAPGTPSGSPTFGWWLTDQVTELFHWAYSWSAARAEEIAVAAGHATSAAPPGIGHFQVAGTDLPIKLQALRLMGEARGIDMSPLLEVQMQWQGLWRRYPQPLDALRHFRECLPETPTTGACARTIGRLRDRLQVEASAMDSRNDGPPRFDSLHAAFQVFSSTLEAVSVPLPDGGRRIDGIAHAIAISDATEVLHRELALAHHTLINRHGRPTGSMPPGITLSMSDTPDGEGTPIPPHEMQVSVMPIGGSGADARLAAALDSAVRASAFPAARYNQQQAVTPGRAQRWFAGDIIPAEDLARLNGASKLIALYRTGLPSISSADAHAAREPSPEPHLLPAHIDVLSTLKSGRAITKDRLWAALPTHGRDAIYAAVDELHSWGLVHCPPNSRKGASIREAGRARLEVIRRSETEDGA